MGIIRINNNDSNILELNKDATETVVMIHGIFTNLSVFYFPVAQELSKKYHVVLYDLKGHGLSGTSDSEYDLRSMSNDLLKILTELDLSKIHLVGYSYGGLIALYTALNYPEKIDKLVVIESPDLSDGQHRPLLEGYDKEFLDQYLSDLSLSTSIANSNRKTAKMHQQVQFLFEHTTFKNDLMKYSDLFVQLAESSISHETLLLYASRTECGNAAKFLNQHIKKSSLHYGEGDHSLPVQVPNWLLLELQGFLGSTN